MTQGGMTQVDMTIATLRQLLNIQADLRELAESRWKGAQRALVSMLETYAPEEVERRLKNAEPLDNLSVEDLVRITIQGINNRLYQKQVRQNAQGEIAKLQAENRRLGEENQALREERDRYQTLLTARKQPAESKLQKPVPIPEGGPLSALPQLEDAAEPDWLVDWRKKETFERDVDILCTIGETGLARRPLIELRLGIRAVGCSIQDPFHYLEELKLIESFRPSDKGGARNDSPSPDPVRLAERGRLAYMLLTGASPVQNECDALLARNVSSEQILFYLQAADRLCEANHQVNLSPPVVHLADGSLFQPDLLAFDPHGKTCYIEVEVEGNQNRELSQAKWRKALQAAGGEIYIFCDNLSCMRTMRSEINFRLGRQAERSYLTNLADLRAGKRAADGGIWLDVRPNPAAS